jgi:hypothetical protein
VAFQILAALDYGLGSEYQFRRPVHAATLITCWVISSIPKKEEQFACGPPWNITTTVMFSVRQLQKARSQRNIERLKP